MRLLTTWARQKLPTLRCFSHTHMDSRNRGTTCTHPPRHRYGVTYLKRAVAVHSLHERGLRQEHGTGRGLIVGAGSYCPGVGQNKRYSASYARLMDDRIEEFVMREELIMLTAAELDVENCRPTDFPEPRRVYAWVRYRMFLLPTPAPYFRVSDLF